MLDSPTFTRHNRLRLAFITAILSTFGLTSFMISSRSVSQATLSRSSPSAFHDSASKTINDPLHSSRPLGIAGRLYVISLVRRVDRRLRMDALAQAMHLNFTYEAATESSDPVVLQIMERVRWERAVQAIRLQWGFLPEIRAEYSGQHNGAQSADIIDWAKDAVPNPYFDVANSSTHAQLSPLGLRGSDLWTLDASLDNRSSQFTNPIPPPPNPDLRAPLPCAPLPLTYPWTSHGDSRTHVQQLARQTHVPAPYPFFKTLSRGMIACWHSHMRVLRLIAEGPDDVGIVFEDDIDMESDLYSRLTHMWSSLPPDWDIVVLGHCWSPEENSKPPIYSNGRSSLHPSVAPKCTHAYAVSKSGASRLIRHLRTAPTSGGTAFAYGRALDQAIVRLIKGRRIRAFSVVPSVVVQTKDGPSDITSGNGSAWRDVLVDSVLAKIGLGMDTAVARI